MTNLDSCFEHPLWDSFSAYMTRVEIWMKHWTWADAYDSRVGDYWWAVYWRTFLAGAESQEKQREEHTSQTRN